MLRVAAAALLLALAACTPFASRTPPSEAARTALPPIEQEWAMARGEVGSVQPGWIAAINDPLLLRLVEEAQENNRDLRQVAAGVAQARAIVGQRGAALWPALNYSGSTTDAGLLEGSSSDSYSAGLLLNWELDLWGRLRANRRSAFLSAESAYVDYVFSQYTLAATVAQTYFQLIEAGLQEEVARKSFSVLAETERIVSAQRKLGAVSALDVALADRDLANAADAVASAEGNRRRAVRALEVLLGRYPRAAVAASTNLPLVPELPPPGLPAELLTRRPDIVAAELALAARFKDVEAAKASRLPTLSLTGSLTGSSPELSEVLESDTAAWQLASNLLGPLFDAGLRGAQIDQAQAAQLQQLEGYAQTVLTAFQEVENSLDQSTILKRRETALTAAATAANRALELARLRYQEGETDLLDVLTIQTTTFNADSALVNVQRLRLDEWIRLNLALGGNWAAP
ncbi:MAG: efflux transporter outer membrane subunit [Pseudomonadota bacterium]